MAETLEGWEEPKRILVILAHPDDPEFFCGATLARWASQGHSIHYCLLTRGDKGVPRDWQGTPYTPQQLNDLREQEQQAAARVLGVQTVRFLDNPDGYLVPDLTLRREVVRVIRQVRPDVIVTSDPTNYFPSDVYINHPDHRAAGQVVLEAVFPAAGNLHFFPELLAEGLEPVLIREVWVTLTHQPNVSIDVTEYWEQKICALYEHASQIGDRQKLTERIRSRHTPDTTLENPRYAEHFRRLILA